MLSLLTSLQLEDLRHRQKDNVKLAIFVTVTRCTEYIYYAKYFIVYNNFSWGILSKGERCYEVNVKNQTVRQGQTTTPGTTCTALFDRCVCSLTSLADHVTLKMQETGLLVLVLIRHLF